MQTQKEKRAHQLHLRPMTEADVPLVLEIGRQAFGEESLTEDDAWVPLLVPNNFALVAESAGTVVGFMLYRRDSFGGFYLSDIAVSPSRQGEGIGRQLITWLQGQLKALGKSAIVLHVKTNNAPARHLYESLGFQLVGIDPHIYEDGQDACVMRYHTGRTAGKAESSLMPLALGGCSRKARP